MKKIITNNAVMMMLTLILLFGGIVQSVMVKDFIWFQRTGSLIVCIGILLLSRPSLVNQSLLPEIGMSDSSYNSNDPRHYKCVGEVVPENVQEDVKNRTAVNKMGPLITFFGTLIWGYGDLLNNFLLNL